MAHLWAVEDKRPRRREVPIESFAQGLEVGGAAPHILAMYGYCISYRLKV